MQLELDEESQQFLTINTSKGLKHFTILPYGVKPASGIFQRVIENALTNISNTAVKIDDILISVRDESEHLQNIEKVFQVLKVLGVTVNKKKCTFFAKEIEYVGFILDKNGVHVNQNKVKAINELAEPKEPHPWDWPANPMDRMHVDYFEYNSNNVLIMVDSYSKWLDVEIIKTCDSKNTITCLSKWFSQYGLPIQLVSDNGPQFTSHDFRNFINLIGVKHIRTAAYHQSSNGQAERYVQTVKKGLESNSGNHNPLKETLVSFLATYRATPHTVTKRTPSEMFIGRNIGTRIDLIKPYQTLEVKSDLHKNNYKLRRFSPNDTVIVRKYGTKHKWEQGKILEKLSCKMYKVLIRRQIEIKHVVQIKKCRTVKEDNNDVGIWDNTIPLTSVPSNRALTPIKQYPKRNRKPVVRYGFEDK